MPPANSKWTIISMAILAIALSSALHEGVGHGLIAWGRGDQPTELTSNHLSYVRPDRLVAAGGTLVNLLAGALAMGAARACGRRRADLRYFFWLAGSFNLMQGAGYFLFSGVLGLGDWQQIIAELPHPVALRIAMSLLGAVLYGFVVQAMARHLQPFCPDQTDPSLYNTLGRLPYYAACAFYCLAGAFDPLGLKVFFLSTFPAAFGGNSGLMWANRFLPRVSHTEVRLTVSGQPGWRIAALIVGFVYIFLLGRGIRFPR